MSTSTKPLHVLIIGNGLAGPCLALSLARHKIRSTIYEIRPTPSLSGGSISLTPNGLKVLDQYANVYSKIKASGFSYYQFGAYTAEGEKLGEIRVAEESRKGEAESYPAIRILRSVLHKVLLEKIDNLGGMIEVNYGMQLERIQEDEKGVVAYFEGGSTAKGSSFHPHIIGFSLLTGNLCIPRRYHHWFRWNPLKSSATYSRRRLPYARFRWHLRRERLPSSNCRRDTSRLQIPILHVHPFRIIHDDPYRPSWRNFSLGNKYDDSRQNSSRMGRIPDFR